MGLQDFDNMQWVYPDELGVAILEAISTIGDNPRLKRIDGEGFKVYWAGNILRVDIEGGVLVR